ncbi:hypothetical protein BMS3Bbin04_00249 [bacterium BMS3Bbin04]|nr:hypothetical protein BMS3Bbin04_00249 [bacterium BMS3Bbin04]
MHTCNRVVLLLLFTVTPFMLKAAEFGQPSNPAGVWEMDVAPGTHLVSFPVLPEDATVTDLLGDQFPGADVWEEATRIMTIDEGVVLGSYYNSTQSEWIGTLSSLNVNRAYWLIVPEGADEIMLRLVGAALTMGEVVVDDLQLGVNCVACPAIVPVTLAGSGLTSSGLLSAEFPAKADRVFIYSDDLLTPAWHNPAQGWVGADFTFHPGKGYLIERVSGPEELEWTRPELVVGAEPDRGGVSPRINPQLRSMLGTSPLNFDSPPWEVDDRAGASSTGGQR